MEKKEVRKKLLLAASVAGLVAVATVGVPASTVYAAQVACEGVNACAGKGDCGGKGHSCAGKNACKGLISPLRLIPCRAGSPCGKI